MGGRLPPLPPLLRRLCDEDKEVAMCVLEGYEERIKNIDVDLQGIERYMLLKEDLEILARRAADLEEGLFEL